MVLPDAGAGIPCPLLSLVVGVAFAPGSGKVPGCALGLVDAPEESPVEFAEGMVCHEEREAAALGDDDPG